MIGNIRYSTSRVSPDTSEIDGGNKTVFKSLLTRTMTNGANQNLFKGPNDDLLL